MWRPCIAGPLLFYSGAHRPCVFVLGARWPCVFALGASWPCVFDSALALYASSSLLKVVNSGVNCPLFWLQVAVFHHFGSVGARWVRKREISWKSSSSFGFVGERRGRKAEATGAESQNGGERWKQRGIRPGLATNQASSDEAGGQGSSWGVKTAKARPHGAGLPFE